MVFKRENNGTLVINTAQRETYDRFLKEKDKLLSGDIYLYDTARIYPDKPYIRHLKPSLLSYLKILWREKPKNIIVIYDGSISQYSYLNVGLFILIAYTLRRKVNYYSERGTYADISDAVPLGWLFTPFCLFRNTFRIGAAYIRCFLSPERNGAVLGFNKYFAPPTLSYETVGKKQLQYGCWGYCHIGEFGKSQREDFYLHYLSYGYLLNKLGFQQYNALAVVLYLISLLVVSVLTGNWLWGVLLLFIVLISPYFTFPFLSYAKPENIAWFLALPAFYCASEGFIIPLAILLLVSTYLSFTVFFFTSACVVALLLSQVNPMILMAFIPAGIKLLVDFYPAIKNGFLPKIIHIISGRSGEKKGVAHRKYEIQRISLRYITLVVFSVILMIIQLILRIDAWPVTAMFILLFLVNFMFVRVADEQSFYRFFLSMLLFGLLSTTNVFFLAGGVFILLVNPRWVDDCGLMRGKDSLKTYPPVEKIIWTKEQDSLLREFIGGVKPGSRVLFEYTGHVAKSPFRNILSLLEAKLFNQNVELLPHEYTFYTHTHFSYDWSCHLSPKGDLDTMDKLLESCSISYVMVFSKDLLEGLLEKGYQLMSEFELDNLRGFIHDERIPADRLWLLYCGRHFNFCSDQSVVLERSPNRMILREVQAGNEYVIRHTYHKDWQAHQGSQRLTVDPIELYGLEFMRVKAVNSCDIVFRFGTLNHIVR
ncbi:hypothetical protein ACFLTO_02805 [Chloroflexota bacterium]